MGFQKQSTVEDTCLPKIDRNITGKQEGPEKVNKEILQYWFLLDPDLVNAISKGNLSLIDLARATINFLKPKIDESLLEEGLKGEEDALCEIHRQLLNNELWIKAANLKIRKEDSQALSLEDNETLRFIEANKHLVHPNTLKILNIKDNESVRMALNQIHYGSLRVRREKINGAAGNGANFPRSPTAMERRDEALLRNKLLAKKLKISAMPPSQPQNNKVLLDFILCHREKIEASILKEVLNGDNRAISFALGQIHHKSLEEKRPKNSVPNRFNTYKAALTQSPPKLAPRKRNSSTMQGPKSSIQQSNTVYLTGFENNLQLRDLWILFRRTVNVKDIILPRKMGMSGKRFGFVITENTLQASRLIGKFHKQSFNN